MSAHEQAGGAEWGRVAAADDRPRDWKDILKRTFAEIGADRVTLVAGGVTYFLLLALFPALTALVSLYGLVVDPQTILDQIDSLAGIVPQGGLALMHDQLVRVAAQGTPTLGFALAISLGLALWSASAGVKALFDAMNIAYDETEKRGFFALNALALGFTLAGVVAGAVMLAAVVAIPAILSVIGLDPALEWVARIASYAVMLATLVLGIAVLYRFGPSRPQAKWRWITPGAVLAVVIIAAVSLLFSWYAANVGHFDQTYGSLGALIGFLFWMWVCLVALIVGAELNAEIERQTAPVAMTAAPSPKAGGLVAAGGDSGGDEASRVRGRGEPLSWAATVPLILGLLLLRRGTAPRQPTKP